MKQTTSFYSLITLLLLLVFTLAACERPLQEEADETATPALNPTTSLDGGGPTIIITPPLSSPTPLIVDPGAGTGEQPIPGTDPSVDLPTATPVPETTIPTEDVIYTVVAGDTLGKIAERYAISVDTIAAANNISNVHTLEVGQQLLIPLSGDSEPAVANTPVAPPAGEEQIHTVQAGETLYRIGLRYGFTIEELAAYNNLVNPNRLEVGQQIRIPPGG